MTTVQFNASGRWVLHQLLNEDDPLLERILEYGIMDPVPFYTPDEIQRLVDVLEEYDSTDVHVMNTELRLKQALSGFHE